MAAVVPNPINIDLDMQRFQCARGYQGRGSHIQGLHNVAKTGDIEAVIYTIDNTANASLYDKLCAYFDCLSQLQKMPPQKHTDSCISALKAKIYRISKIKTNRAEVLQSIRSDRVAENSSLQNTIKKALYLTKDRFCQTKKGCCCCSVRGTRFSHQLSKIYGNLSRPEMSSGLTLFSTAATGLMGAGLSALFADQFTLAMLLLGFAGGITSWTILNAIFDAFGDTP